MSARHWTCLHQKRGSPPEGASRNISKYFTQNNQSPFYQYLCWQLEFYPLSYRLVRSFQSQKMLYLLIRCHPVQKKRTNSKWIFTEKIMPESKSLGKRYKEKRCHLRYCVYPFKGGVGLLRSKCVQGEGRDQKVPKTVIKVIPVKPIDWTGTFFPALTLGLCFSLFIAIFCHNTGIRWQLYICRIQWAKI